MLSQTPKRALYQNFQGPVIEVGHPEEISPQKKEHLLKQARELIPWRKGPFQLFGHLIDGQWRCDLKWERFPPLSLQGKTILDVGCNNGYFMFRMLPMGPKCVVGLDPVARNRAQFELIQSYVQDPRLEFLPLGFEDLPRLNRTFDTIFSLGVIYHHRGPLGHLRILRDVLAPGGELYLEGLIWPSEEDFAVTPRSTYASMKNVFFLPTLKCLHTWAYRCRFTQVETLNVSETTPSEQRATAWCPSCPQFFDPQNPSLTLEGLPRPRRALLRARA